MTKLYVYCVNKNSKNNKYLIKKIFGLNINLIGHIYKYNTHIEELKKTWKWIVLAMIQINIFFFKKRKKYI